MLFDQGTPVPLRKFLTSHTVVTASESGWAAIENGELIQAAESKGFDAIVTTDQNLKYQQNLQDRLIAIIVLKTTSWPRIKLNIEFVVSEIGAVTPGDYREIEIQ